jgi:hypothetical protein
MELTLADIIAGCPDWLAVLIVILLVLGIIYLIRRF